MLLIDRIEKANGKISVVTLPVPSLTTINSTNNLNSSNNSDKNNSLSAKSSSKK